MPINKTDHISYDPPTATRPQQREYDIMMTKPRYAKNHQSTQPWVIYDDRERLDRLDKAKETDTKKGEASSSKVPESKRSNLPPSQR
jgi:hypothetical protein